MDGRGSDPPSLDDEADRLWLEHAIRTPDVWRTRSTSAAGLLSAAAAATIAGLLLRAESPTMAERLSLIAAAVGYILAVVSFLLAGVWPSPERDVQTLHVTEEIWDYVIDEARPIKRLVACGTFAAVFAIVGTGLALLLLSGASERLATVRFLEPVTGDTVSDLCPMGTGPMRGSVTFVTEDRIRLELPAGVCSATETELELPRQHVALEFED